MTHIKLLPAMRRLPLVRMLVLPAAIFWASDGAGAESYKSVVVDCNDGSNISITLTTTLSFGFTTEAFVADDTDMHIEIPRSLLAGFHVSEEEAGVDEVSKAMPVHELTSDGVWLRNLPAGVSVMACGADGIVRYSAKPDAECFIPYGVLASGLNIIAMDGMTFKVTVP